MNKKPPSPGPRTNKEAVVALMLGEIDTLLDKLGDLKAGIDSATDKHLETIKQLEDASDAYHQAVLTANLRSKNEMLAYLETVSKTNVASTAEEQRMVVQALIRDAVSNEIIALKKVLSETSANHQIPFKERWGSLLLGCIITAIISSTITVSLIKYVGLN